MYGDLFFSILNREILGNSKMKEDFVLTSNLFLRKTWIMIKRYRLESYKYTIFDSVSLLLKIYSKEL